MALPPHPNPVLAVTLPIVLSQPPGVHPPTEALRLALLGVGAVHQAYLMLRARVQGNLTGPSLYHSQELSLLAAQTAVSAPVPGMIEFGPTAGGGDAAGGSRSGSVSGSVSGSGGLLDVDTFTLLSGHQQLPALGMGMGMGMGMGSVGASTSMSTMNMTNAMEAMLAQGGAEDARGLLALSAMMRLQATRYLALACQNHEEIRSDAALGATMAVVLIDIFSGGHQWMKNIGLAKALIASRGGPNAILNMNRPTQMRFGGGVTVSAARFWLEMLAVYETFGSLTSGEEPTLLAPGNADWWNKDPTAGYHANSIEKVFGMARSMVLIIAKVSCFLCRGIREHAVITELGPNEEETDGVGRPGNAHLGRDPIVDFDFDKWLNDIGAAGTPGATAFLPPATSVPQPPQPPQPPPTVHPDVSALPGFPALDEALVGPSMAMVAGPNTNTGMFGFMGVGGAVGASGPSGLNVVAGPDARLATLRMFFNDAKELYAEVENWQDVVPLEDRDARVLAGNRTHQLAMQIVILRDIFHVDRIDPRVQEFATRILELCVECAEQRMGIDLTWPVIISGSQVQALYYRQQVIMAFDYFRQQCCFEIESSQRIVAEVWRRMDADEPRDDWRSVVEDLGLRILVL